jgi:hypothetical protein
VLRLTFNSCHNSGMNCSRSAYVNHLFAVLRSGEIIHIANCELEILRNVPISTMGIIGH